MMMRYPDRDACIVLLLNRDRTPLHDFAARLESALIDDDMKLPPSRLAPNKVKAFVGQYVAPSGAVIEIAESKEGAPTFVYRFPERRPLNYFLAAAGDDAAVYTIRSTIPLAVARKAGKVTGLTIFRERFVRKP